MSSLTDDQVHDCCIEAAQRYTALNGVVPMWMVQDLSHCYHSELYVGAALTIVALSDEAPYLPNLDADAVAKWALTQRARRRNKDRQEVPDE